MKSLLRKKASSGGKKNNVMSPLNWMCGVSETGVLVLAAKNHDNWLGPAAFWLGAAILAFYGIMYIYYSLKDPDRLQTEEYNLINQEMRLLINPADGQSPAVRITGDTQERLLSEATSEKAQK